MFILRHFFEVPQLTITKNNGNNRREQVYSAAQPRDSSQALNSRICLPWRVPNPNLSSFASSKSTKASSITPSHFTQNIIQRHPKRHPTSSKTPSNVIQSHPTISKKHHPYSKTSSNAIQHHPKRHPTSSKTPSVIQNVIQRQPTSSSVIRNAIRHPKHHPTSSKTPPSVIQDVN